MVHIEPIDPRPRGTRGNSRSAVTVLPASTPFRLLNRWLRRTAEQIDCADGNIMVAAITV